MPLPAPPTTFRHDRANLAVEWAVAILLSANLAWTSLRLGGVRADTMILSWLLTGVTLALVVIKEILGGRRGHWSLYCLLPFLLYAAINAQFVSPVRWLGERDVWHWFQMFAMYAIALDGVRSPGPRRVVLATIALLGATAIALGGYQLAGHETWLMLGRTQATQYVGRASGFFGNPNTLAAFFALLAPPFLALAWRRGASGVMRVACGYVALAFIIGLALTMSRGGLLALTLALLCWPWLVREWPWKKRARAFSLALGGAALAFAALWTALPSLRERMRDFARDNGEKSRPILWQASLKMTAGAPLLGTGAGSFNTLFEKYRPEGFRDEPQWAHNDFLNTLSDYGIVGFALLFGGIGVIAWKSRRAPWSAAAEGEARRRRFALSPDFEESQSLAEASFARALCIGLFAFCFACLVDFHLKIPALAMIVAVIAAEIVKRRESLANPGCEFASVSETNPPRKRKFASLALKLIVACLLIVLQAWIIFGIMKSYRAEAYRAGGREDIDSLVKLDIREKSASWTYFKKLMEADALFSEALRCDPENPQIWSDRSYKDALLTRLRPNKTPVNLGEFAEGSARRALALSNAVPEFWIRLGVALDLQGRAAEAGDAFSHALQLAPASAFVWFHQAYHLSLTPATRHLALAAAETCLRLDPGYADADKLRLHLQTNE